MKKVKILHVENSCWDVYKFRTPFLEQMKEMGMEVILVAPLDEYLGRIDTALYDGFIEVKTLKAQHISPLSDLRYIFELKKILRREKPDLALFYTIKPSIYGGLASQWTGTPAIVFLTGLGYAFYNGRWLMHFVTWLSKKAFGKLKKVVVYNDDDGKRLSRLNIISSKKQCLIPSSGVDTTLFVPSLPNERSNTFVFLYIGRLIATKGLRELVAATEMLKNSDLSLECWLVGDHSFSNPFVIPKREVNDWVSKGLVRYFGATDDVRKYIRKADVVVLPSYGEGKPKVLQEAMAMAKPIITTFTPGCREMVIHGENGLLVPPGDAMALSEAMRYMMELPPSTLEAMGRKGREIVVDRYSTSVTKQHFARLLDEVLRQTPAPVGHPQPISH